MTIAQLVSCLDKPITVVDVGCRWGFNDQWNCLLPQLRLIGFDPSKEECERLLDAQKPHIKLVPLALGRNAERRILHVTENPGCSSLYPPDAQTIASRPSLRCATKVSEVEVDTVTLDSWLDSNGIRKIDVIKLDTQGSELDILVGAVNTLKTVIALEIEVEFNPIYAGQPLFADVDTFLRQHGFVLWRLGHLVHYGFSSEASRYDVNECQYFDDRRVSFMAQGGQLFWGHAYYIREILLSSVEARTACVAYAMGFADLYQMYSKAPHPAPALSGEVHE